MGRKRKRYRRPISRRVRVPVVVDLEPIQHCLRSLHDEARLHRGLTRLILMQQTATIAAAAAIYLLR